MLLRAVVRPRIFRGTTLAAQRRPPELLVGGEALLRARSESVPLGSGSGTGIPVSTQALPCSPSQGPGPEHLPLRAPQWGSDRPWLLEGHHNPQAAWPAAAPHRAGRLCSVSLPCFPSRAAEQCGSPDGFDGMGKGQFQAAKGPLWP